MGRLVVSTYVALDGVMEAPEEWSIKFFNEEAMEYARGQLAASDALLMGRKTYEGFAAAWPSRGGDPFSDRMNALPKHVASATLEGPWGGTTRRSSRGTRRGRCPPSRSRRTGTSSCTAAPSSCAR